MNELQFCISPETHISSDCDAALEEVHLKVLMVDSVPSKSELLGPTLHLFEYA